MTTLSPPQSSHSLHDRPRAVSAMSFSSNRSRRSSTSNNKLELTESAKEKEKRRLNTKADPTKALNEAQPAVVALEQSNLDDIRLLQHKDSEGNVITDPDRSNPTRYRMERPLDTIRSFNAAAEGTSQRRTFNSRPPSMAWQDNSQGRRTSYYGNNGPMHSPQRQRPNYGGYYRNSSYGYASQNYIEESPGAHQQHYRGGRQHSNPYYGQVGESPVSSHSNQYSYDTMTSGSDENGKSTNPSSLNSSYDQLHQLRKPEEPVYENPYQNDFNFTPLPQQQPYAPYDMADTSFDAYGQPQMQRGPPPPPKQYAGPNNPRQPIPLNGSNPVNTLKKSESTKRQSWIKRKFSRNGES